jgi:hypothetical protein
MCAERATLCSFCSSSFQVVVTTDFILGGALGVPRLSVLGENPSYNLQYLYLVVVAS